MKPSPELVGMAKRLELDYRERIAELEGGFSVWANTTQVGVEIPLGGVLGRRWHKTVRYARRMVPFGRPLETKTIEQVETELRGQIEAWIAQSVRST